jgi:hypothetical protein
MTQRNERIALEAAAKHLAAARIRGRASGDASVTLAGNRIALKVVALRPQAARARRPAKPTLRLDRVALGLVSRVRTAIQGQVPDERTIVVTITAPIRLAAKTAAALASRIPSRASGRARVERSLHRIHGNRIQVWILPGGVGTTSKLVGFVHNPDVDPRIFIEVTRALLAAVGPHRHAAARPTGARWLLIENEDDRLPIDTYRNVCQQLRLTTAFQRLLVALPDGRIERLRSCG